MAICNRGAKALSKVVPVTVYQGAKPAPGSKALCTAMTMTLLTPGACETVTCTVAPAPKTPTDLHAVANDDGSGKAAVVECQGKNNWALLKGVACP